MYIYATSVVFGKFYAYIYSSYHANVVLDITKVVDVYVVTVVGYFVKKKNEKQYNILHT